MDNDAHTIANIRQRMLRLERVALDNNSIDSYLEDLSIALSELNDLGVDLSLSCYKDTSNEGVAQAYQRFLDTAKPELDSMAAGLVKRVVSADLNSHKYANVITRLKTEANLFNSANIQLEKQENNLLHSFDMLRSKWTVDFQGESIALSQAKAKLKTLGDRTKREELWKGIQEAQAPFDDEITEIFVELVKLRRQKATNAGLNDWGRIFVS